MNTKETDGEFRVATWVVTGARHLRTARNGQDAVFVCYDDERAVAVVCDGCSSGASSEVGARLGAMLFARAVFARLEAGEQPSDHRMWAAARAQLAETLRTVAGVVAATKDCLSFDVLDAPTLRECFLFTIVAVAITRDAAAVWALGDGAYVVDGTTTRLGPFANNAPPYLAYDLFGDARDAHFAILPAEARTIPIAS